MLIGYPPPDEVLHDWLLSLVVKEQNDVAKQLHGFLSSLLDVTLQRLKAIEIGETLYDYSWN